MGEQPEVSQFIADCEELLARHGKVQPSFVGGTLRRDAVCVDTAGLKVARGPATDLEIRVVYTREDGSAGDNPVIARDEKGLVYRYSAEWTYGRARVARLLAGEQPVEPIQLGKGGSGWTTGLD
ncbi:hypothetical protein [Ottowia sp.]|uniref:hypothetical protein n=1 Tax=Ottowia sp. TaxID=1898956 RepID=UPI0025EC136A|nr:hypothetical protein [Ottowia sp.]MBK6616087.1 hypothetical protein [Ottowia sp.]